MRYRTTSALRTRAGLLTSAAAILALGSLNACSDLPADDLPAPIHELVISATDFAYILPDTIPAGLTRIRFTADGKEHHHAQLARLHPGHTVEQLRDTLAARRLPTWVTFQGGPNAPAPGEASEVVVDLRPGTYAVLCFVTSSDKVAHLAKGMIRELIVVPSKAGRQPEPKADVELVLKDYGFTFTPSLSAGRRTIRVENRGPQPHEVIFVRLQPGRTLEEVLAWLKTEEGPAPGEVHGGTVALQTGEVNYVNGDFPAGDYALICFVPDVKDGKPHIAHGMVSQIRVS